MNFGVKAIAKGFSLEQKLPHTVQVSLCSLKWCFGQQTFVQASHMATWHTYKNIKTIYRLVVHVQLVSQKDGGINNADVLHLPLKNSTLLQVIFYSIPQENGL